MIKKLILLALVGLMSISMLTGCGVNDLGYLKFSKELSNITEYSFENKTQIEIAKEASGEPYNIDVQLAGVANLEDLDSMYMSFDLLFKLNDIVLEKPINFKIVDNKFYVSKSALLEVIALEELANDTSSSEKVINEIYNNDLKNVEYILLTDLGEVYKGKTNEEITDNALNYLTSAFKGFDSKLITQTAKGYTIELTSETALSFVNNLFKYLGENKELVFDETVKYVEGLYGNMKIEGFTEEQKQEMFKELRNGRQDFYNFIDEAIIVLDSGEFDSYADMIKGSNIKEEVYKEGNTYKDISEIEIVYEAIKMGKLVSNTTITPVKVEKTAITGGVIKVEELESLYKIKENKINPVQKMELEWYLDSFDVQLNNTRLEGNTNIDSQPYKIIDGRIYLPLRNICESFGEEVEWDNANSKAYIIRGTEKIDMSGVIIDSKTMIKVRDFEKLGYKIGYTQDNELSRATIEK